MRETAQKNRPHCDLEVFYPKGSGLLLWGDVGTGKSYVAASIANALISQGIPALMTSFTRI